MKNLYAPSLLELFHISNCGDVSGMWGINVIEWAIGRRKHNKVCFEIEGFISLFVQIIWKIFLCSKYFLLMCSLNVLTTASRAIKSLHTEQIDPTTRCSSKFHSEELQLKDWIFCYKLRSQNLPLFRSCTLLYGEAVPPRNLLLVRRQGNPFLQLKLKYTLARSHFVRVRIQLHCVHYNAGVEITPRQLRRRLKDYLNLFTCKIVFRE